MMKRRILQTIVSLLAIACGATAQTLSVASIEAKPGDQAELVVSASGMSSVTALQFNLSLPQGMTLNENAITKGSAVNGHELVVETTANGERLFVLYNMNLGQIGNGTLLKLPITVGQQSGTFSGSLNTIRTATTDAVSHDCANVTFNVTVKTTVQSVTITAENKTMTYGDNVPTLTYKSSGATLNGTPKLSTTATKTSPVGTYPIKVEKGTVTNEEVTYVDGTLTIEKAPLTVGVQDVTITEGDAIPSFTMTYSGFRNSDTETNAFTTKPTAKTTATSASKAGTYPITVSGGEAKNYALTYTQGTLTIKEKEQGPVSDGVYPLTIDMFHEWDGCTATSKVVNENCGGEIHVGETLGAGNLVYGGSSVLYTQYADLTDYDVLAIVGTPGMEFRVLLNRLEVGNGGGDDHGGSWTELNPTIGEDGRAIIELSNYNFVHLNAIKTGWGSPEGIIEKLLIAKGKDNPLSINNINDGIRNQYPIFNLSGQRLASPRKGINVINGKKVVVK